MAAGGRQSVAAGPIVRHPIDRLAAEGAKVDLVVLVSDNESWVDARPGGRGKLPCKKKGQAGQRP
jgi:hypothetical protein